MGFSQALSGINAAATNLEVIGNNIANSQTVGFKGARTLFADVFAEATAGLGTRVAAVLQDFSVGTLENTGRSLDLAVSGSGFFRFVQQNGQVVFSRNGQLTISSEGYFINASGAKLSGYTPDGAGSEPVALQLAAGGVLANPTSVITTNVNLDARTIAVDRSTTPFDPVDAKTYSYSNNISIFDSQGKPHSTTIYFSKISDNTWQVNLSRAGELATQTAVLNFDTNGSLASSTGLGSFTFSPGGGVADIDLAMKLDGSTQFGNDFEQSAVDQDGHTSGSLVGVLIDEVGNVVGNYSNQKTKVLGTILLANFIAPEGLQSVGDNSWTVTTTSGQPLLGLAGSGRLGSIESGVVENSNVDLTKELVNLIIAQRNYQANSQTIKVQDEVLQNAVNLR